MLEKYSDINKHSLIDSINFYLLEDANCRKEVCIVMESLIDFGIRENCADVIIGALKDRLLEIINTSKFKVIDMDFGVEIYDSRTAIYKYIYDILSSNKIKHLARELRVVGNSRLPKGNTPCMDKYITYAIDLIGYSRFLSSDSLELIKVSISSVYATISNGASYDLYTDSGGTNYSITLFYRGSENEYIVDIVNGFAKLFTALCVQFGLDKEVLRLKRGSQTNSEFIEKCFVNYVLSLDSKTSGLCEKQYTHTFTVIESLIGRL